MFDDKTIRRHVHEYYNTTEIILYIAEYIVDIWIIQFSVSAQLNLIKTETLYKIYKQKEVNNLILQSIQVIDRISGYL